MAVRRRSRLTEEEEPQGNPTIFDDSDVERWKVGLAIHLEALHEDCATHPSMYSEIAYLAAYLKGIVAQAKHGLETTKASVALAIRDNPEDYNLDRVTEGAVLACVQCHDNVVKALKELRDAQMQYDVVSSFASAFEHRRSMLNNEVNLFQADYWSSSGTALVGDESGKEDFREERVEQIKAAKASKRKRRGE